MSYRLDGVLTNDNAGSTVEWMMVTGICVLLSYFIGLATQVIMEHIFVRSVLIIASPMG